ncbi:MAG: hypothetical protein U0X87_02645 [Anaerolineales bacterium]
MLRRFSTYLYSRPKVTLALLLGPPMLYMVVVYLGSLFGLLLNSFFYLDDFSGKVIHSFTLSTYAQLFTRSNLLIINRTVLMALAVTLADALIAFPLARLLHGEVCLASHEVFHVSCRVGPAVVELSCPCVCVSVDPRQRGDHQLGFRSLGVAGTSRLGAQFRVYRRTLAGIIHAGDVHHLCVYLASIHDIADSDRARARAQIA